MPAKIKTSCQAYITTFFLDQTCIVFYSWKVAFHINYAELPVISNEFPGIILCLLITIHKPEYAYLSQRKNRKS